MTDTSRTSHVWSLTERSRNTRQLMVSLRSTRVRLDREWERPDEVAWAEVSVGRGNDEVTIPPADLDELIELLQEIRDDLTDLEVSGPHEIRKYNDQLRSAKREAARAEKKENQ